MRDEKREMRKEIYSRRDAHPEPSGAAGWVEVVLHGTPNAP